jgi:hypothetical protein
MASQRGTRIRVAPEMTSLLIATMVTVVVPRPALRAVGSRLSVSQASGLQPPASSLQPPASSLLTALRPNG